MVDISPDEIVIVVKDAGPGIEDIERAMQKGLLNGFSNGTRDGIGAGMGLFNMKSNSDSLEIKSIGSWNRSSNSQ